MAEKHATLQDIDARTAEEAKSLKRLIVGGKNTRERISLTCTGSHVQVGRLGAFYFAP